MKNYRALWARYLLGVDSFLLFQFSHSSCLLFLGWVCVLGLPSCRLSYLTSLFHAESVASCAYFAAGLSACPHCLGHTFQVIPPALPVVTHPQVSHLSARGYTAVPPGPLIPVSWHAPMPSVPHCIFLPLSQRSPFQPHVALFLFHDYKLVFHLMAFASTVPLLGERSRFSYDSFFPESHPVAVTATGGYMFTCLLSVFSVKILPVWGDLIRVPPAVSDVS